MPAVPSSGHPSVKISGRDLRDFGVELAGYPSLMMPSLRRRDYTISQSHGAVDFGGVYEPWDFTLNAQVRGEDHEDAVAKKHDFLDWIDHATRIEQEFLLVQRTIQAMTFELSGHFYEYTTGTASVTISERKVTGSGTEWASKIFPGSKFVVQGDTTVYTVLSVESDTVLYLDQDMVRTTGSGLTYRLERRRYLCINYGGSSDISAISGARGQFKDRIYPFSISFRAAYPFWVGDKFEQETLDPASTYVLEWTTLKGLGRVPMNPSYVITGGSATTDPTITAVEHTFTCDYDDWTTGGNPNGARLVKNDVDVAATTVTSSIRTLDEKFMDTRAISMHGSWARMHGDVITAAYTGRIAFTEGTLSAWLMPYADWNDGEVHTIFYTGVDTSNFIRLRKSPGSQLQFSHVAGGTTVVLNITVTEEKISAGQKILVVARWDADSLINGTDTAALDLYYTNDSGTPTQESVVSTSALGTLSGTPTVIRIGHEDSNGTNSIDSVIDDFGIWDILLSEANIDALWNGGTGATADTVASASLVTYLDFDGTSDGAVLPTSGEGQDVKNATTFDLTVTTMFDNEATSVYEPAIEGNAININNTMLHRWFNVANTPPNAFSFILRTRLMTPSDVVDNGGNYYLFNLASGSVTEEVYLRLDTSGAPGTDGDLELVISSAGGPQTLQCTPIAWKAGQWAEIGCSSDINGTTILLFNGVKIGSAAASWGAFTSALNRVVFYSWAYNSTRTSFPQYVDSFQAFGRALSEDELRASFYEQRSPRNRSRTMKYTGTVASGDQLALNVGTGQHQLIDVSAGTNTVPSNVSGPPAFLHGDENEEAIIYTPVAATSIKTISQAHYR